MPHFILEYSNNFDTDVKYADLFSSLHELLVSTGVFELSAIKSRAIPVTNYFVADGNLQNVFVHLTLKILPGRSIQVKNNIADQVFTTLLNFFSQLISEQKYSITFELVELEMYRKNSTL